MPEIALPTLPNDESIPTVHLGGLDAEQLFLVGSFVEILREWRSGGQNATTEFQLLWRRLELSPASESHQATVMTIVLDSQRPPQPQAEPESQRRRR
jgi:hypothetical protein